METKDSKKGNWKASLNKMTSSWKNPIFKYYHHLDCPNPSWWILWKPWWKRIFPNVCSKHCTIFFTEINWTRKWWRKLSIWWRIRLWDFLEKPCTSEVWRRRIKYISPPKIQIFWFIFVWPSMKRLQLVSTSFLGFWPPTFRQSVSTCCKIFLKLFSIN